MNSINERPSTQEFLDDCIQLTLEQIRRTKETGKGMSALRIGVPGILRIPERFPTVEVDMDAIDEIRSTWAEIRHW